jgi:hypothetical protein
MAWPRYYPNIYLERLRKATKYLSRKVWRVSAAPTYSLKAEAVCTSTVSQYGDYSIVSAIQLLSLLIV